MPVLCAILSSCGSQSKTEEAQTLHIVTTSTMVTDLVENLVGDKAKVTGLMGEGVDPHSYQATLSDTAAIKKADVIFYSGLHLEGKVQHSLEAHAEKGNAVYAVTDAFTADELLSAEEDFPGAKDPHVWGNAKLWAKTPQFVAEKLAAIDPANAEIYRSNAKALTAEYQALHEWAVKRANEIPKQSRLLITSHDAFFYFGDAYGFKVSGLQGISTESQTSLKHRANLIKKIKKAKIKAIFPESSVNAKGIQAVAKEAGIELSKEELFSDAMGKKGDTATINGETYDKGTYPGMIKHNINTIVEALK